MVTSLLTPTHIAIALIAVLLIVGPKRIPETGRALGSDIREFKQAITGRDPDSTAARAPTSSLPLTPNPITPRRTIMTIRVRGNDSSNQEEEPCRRKC
jgi:sec-independent protein translocase protein TatA